MGRLRSVLLLAVGAIIGGTVFLAYRVSQETGKPLLESFADVPAEIQRLNQNLRTRVSEAVERGREAYWEKQQEMDERAQ